MFTPLMAVCASTKNEEDLLKCCSLLLKYGAKVNAYERHLTTPLMFAAREGHAQLVKELLDHDADPNMKDNRGNTALAWAASCGHGQVVRHLVEKGADVNIFNNVGLTAVELAYENGHNEVVSLLQKGHFAKDRPSETSASEMVTTHSSKSISQMSKSFPNVKNYVKLGDLDLFLTGIGLKEFLPVFSEHQLNFHDLLIMNDEELEKVGIKQVGVRKKILEACKAVHKKEWQDSSLPNLKQCHYISCPDAVAMMANIAKHLKYISISVNYIRLQIQSNPRILELSQDSANVHDLIDEMEDSLKNVRNLNDELRFFKMHLEKVQDKVQYIPADLIVETVPQKTKGRKVHTAIAIVVTSAIIVGILWKHPVTLNSIQSCIQIKVPQIPFLR
ncbi:Ankyrin repeat, SAM and basic leucine zipper domain-containing protein 1, partial [Stegodyphus mimosarum]